jgi:hypothetical protein
MFRGVLIVACVDFVFGVRKQYIEPVKHSND